MGIAPEKLVRWIGVQIADITGEGSVSSFELLYTSHHEKQRLEVFDLSDISEELDAQDFASLIYKRAEDDAADRDSPSHRYELLAWRCDQDVHDSCLTFRITGKLTHLAQGETEPPTENGLVGQTMRHLEHVMMTLHRTIDSSNGALVRDLEQERHRRLSLEHHHEQILQLKEKLIENVDERSIRLANEQKNQERKDAILTMFIESAPMLLSALAVGLKNFSKPVANSKPSENSQPETKAKRLLKDLISDLGSEKIGEIAALLEPKQQSKLMTIVETLNHEKSEPDP